MTRVVEVRSLSLKPGTRDEFWKLLEAQSRPIQTRRGIDIVRVGPSLHHEDGFFVLRSFASVTERQQVEDEFYASDDWRKGPRAAVLALIETYIDAVFEVSDAALAALRETPDKAQHRTRTLEIRSYTLKPGMRETFHRLFETEAGPMLARWKIDVVRAGPSLYDENGYFLIRAFASAADRDQVEDAFYGSSEWRQGPRGDVLACIETYHEALFDAPEAAIELLRYV